MRNQKSIFLTILLLLCFSPFAFCETITLKSGKVITGKILERTEQYIKVEVDGNPVYYELKYILNIQAAKEDIESYLRKGFQYASDSKFKEAQDEFQKGLNLAPQHHNLKEPMRIFEDLKAGKISQEYALNLFKGSNYLLNAQYQEAIPEFKKALTLKGESADLNYYLGVCHYSLEEYSEAIVYLKNAVKIKPDVEIYYYLGVSHYSLGEYPEAITQLEKVVEINPNDAEAYSIIGTSYFLLGQSRQAKENLLKAKELFQNKGDYLKSKDIEDFLTKID